MQDYVVGDNIILSGKNRKIYAISTGICILIVLITFMMPIISFYGQSVSILDIFSLAGTVDSFGAITGTSEYIGSGYRSMIFLIFFLPLIIVGVVSFINLKKTNKVYAIITIVIAAIASVYSYIVNLGIAEQAQSLPVLKMTPVIIQVIAYALIAAFTFVFILEPIQSQMKGRPYKGINVNPEQAINMGKKMKKTVSRVAKNGKNAINNPQMSRFELENMRLKDSIENLERNIGEYVYGNRIDVECTSEFIKKIDNLFETIGKNRVEMLRSDGKKVCTKCGNLSGNESRFCSECGNPYAENERYSQEDYIRISKKHLEIKNRNQVTMNLMQENRKVRETIENTYVEIGVAVYSNPCGYDDFIENNVHQISSMRIRMEENKKSDLEARGMMLCSNCKKEIGKNSKFCEYCGNKIASDEGNFAENNLDSSNVDDKENKENTSAKEDVESKESLSDVNKVNLNKEKSDNQENKDSNVCSGCGAKLEESDKFCTQCGTKVK